MAGTAYIINTNDGLSSINYSDGSVQVGTEEQLRETLAANLPNYEIKVVDRNYSMADNRDRHQAKYDVIGDHAAKQMEKFGTTENPLDRYDVAGTGWASGVKALFSSDASIPDNLDEWKVTGSKRNYSLTFKDGTSIKLSGLNRYDDEAPRIQKLLNNLKSYKQELGAAANKTKNTFNTLMKSYDHFVQTGEDDGGGFIDPKTGLPPGVANQQEAFLLRSGNFKMTSNVMSNILDKASQSVKDDLIKGYGSLENAATGLLSSSMGSLTDARDFGRLLAVSRLGSDAFVQAISIATRQNWERGVLQTDANGNPIGYYGKKNLTVDKELGTGKSVYLGAGNQRGELTDESLRGIWFTPNDVQGILEGDVYKNYTDYYNKFRKSYEFMNGTDFLKLQEFKPVVSSPSQTSGASASPGVGSSEISGEAAGVGSGTYTPPADTGAVTYQTTGSTSYTPAEVNVNAYDTTQPQLGGAGTTTYAQSPVSGTFNVGSQTAELSAVPSSVTVQDNYTGTSMANLTSQSQGGFGGQRQYQNAFGQRITVTEDAQGNPMTYVPPGFTKAAEGGLMGFAEGGDVKMARRFLGFDGPADQLENFLASNPQAAARMGKYRTAMVGLSNTRMGAQSGTLVPTQEQFKEMQGSLVGQTMQPQQAAVQQITPQAADFVGQGAGQVYAVSPFAQAATIPTTAQAGMPQTVTPSLMQATTAAGDVKDETAKLTAQTGTLSEQAQVSAAQQTETSVSGMEGAQGTAIMMDNPVQREIQQGELISGEANAEKASQYAEQIQAATATPSKKATVQGQLEDLMAQFEGGETPPWAAGSMRSAMATLSARGLGASSLAGQAVIQAAMEAALPIAQIDAATQAQFESQNLSNRQQRAMLAAQQRATFLGQEFDQAFQARVANASRIADIANMNFNAEQQVALENSRAANTINLQNLTNRQAMVMSEAAALAQLDMANLNNRQQAAVQNAQNFMQMDMANLNNEQQTAIFRAQQNIQALFTDQAAENAAAQFNATSENQTNQFFASLTSQVSQFNAAQQNAIDQFNAGQVNALREFNSNLQQQRDMFNAQNGLVVAQANAQWRQNIATLNTAAQNESNMNFAQTINALTSTNLDQIWQRERDLMSFAFTGEQSAADRALQIVLADKELEAVRAKIANDDKTAKGALWTKLLFGLF